MKNKRSNGDGSIYYEKSRQRWVCALIDPSGKRVIKRFKTEQEAKDHLTVTKSSIITNDYIQPSQITFGQWLIDYIKLYVVNNAAPGTIKTYTNQISYAEPIADIPIQKLTTNTLQRIINDLPENLNDTSKHEIGMMFKRALRKAVVTRIINFNPMDGVVVPSKLKTDIETFSIEEMNKILTYLEQDKKRHRDLVIFKTLFATGMRIGEVLALQETDICDEYITVSKTTKRDNNGRIILGPTKGKKMRKINVPNSIIALLRSCKADEQGFLFNGKINKSLITENSMHDPWKSILKASGVAYRKIHAIRHTHATQLLENGVSLAEVSERLGHASITITLNTYSHTLNDIEHKRDVTNKIAKIFNF